MKTNIRILSYLVHFFLEREMLQIIVVEKIKKTHIFCSITLFRTAELIKAGGSTIRCANHKLIIAIWNKEELPGEWKESNIIPIHKKGIKQIVITRGAYHFCQLRTKFCPTSCFQG